MKKILILLLAEILMVFSISYPVSAITLEDFSYKLDKGLAEKLEEMDDNDVIPVSIWVDDIDQKKVKAKALSRIKGKVSDDVFKIAKASGNTEELLKLNQQETTKTIEERKKDSIEIQKYIVAERKISANEYTISNNSILEECINPNKFNNFYICKFAPNINISLKKKEIVKIICDKRIDSVYYNKIINIPETKNKKLKTIKENNLVSVINTDFYDVTNLSTVRDAFGCNGSNMKVGMVDMYRPYESLVTDQTIYHSYGVMGNSNLEFHPTIVAKLMIGKINDYVGAIPNADLYYANLGNINNIKQGVEALIGDMVTAINISCGVDENTYNTYGDYSKWFDHVALYHSVHLVFAAGNYGSNGVSNSSMSYNSIIVGNCYNDGELYAPESGGSSSYNNNINGTYKPDIVAPGTGFNVVPQAYGELQSTSYAAPLITSAVIQLAQIDSTIKLNPRLMKAVILSGSKITNYMGGEPMISQQNETGIALSRSYGSGMLNVANSYVAYHDKSYAINDTLLSAYTYGTVHNKVIKGLNKKVRFVLCWDKKVSIPASVIEQNDHLGNCTQTALDHIKLKVTTPSGKIYYSAYNYDNKQVITISPGENGTYQIQVIRMLPNVLTNVDYSICASVQS